MTSASQSATETLEELIRQLGDEPGPLDRVVAQWQGSEAASVASSLAETPAGERALKVIDELGESWGPNGDPSWVDGLVGGRPDDGRGAEMDFMFGLYWRPGIFAFARLRGDNNDAPKRVRLILGVVRMPTR